MTKSQAITLGKDTIKKMRTTGWKVHLFQDCRGGTYFVYIYKGMMTVRPSIDIFGKVSYTVTFSEHHLGASTPEWNINKRFLNPNAAVNASLKLATKHIKLITNLVKTVRAELKCPSSWVA